MISKCLVLHLYLVIFDCSAAKINRLIFILQYRVVPLNQNRRCFSKIERWRLYKSRFNLFYYKIYYLSLHTLSLQYRQVKVYSVTTHYALWNRCTQNGYVFYMYHYLCKVPLFVQGTRSVRAWNRNRRKEVVLQVFRGNIWFVAISCLFAHSAIEHELSIEWIDFY